MSTEYSSKYNRRLWDAATRSNYFKLVEDRRQRLLRATTHAPIHWEHKADEFEKTLILESPRKPTTTNCITSTLSPPPPAIKQAWGEKESRPSSAISEFELIELEDVSRPASQSLKRSKDQRSPTPSPINCAESEERKRLRTPNSGCPPVVNERKSPICRPRSAPASRLSDYDKIKKDPKLQQTETWAEYSRPYSANKLKKPRPSSSNSRISLDHEKTHSISRNDTPMPKTYKSSTRPIQLNEGEYTKPRIAYDVPRCFEKNEYYKNRQERLKVHKAASDKLKDCKNLSHAVKSTKLPRDIGSWVTEYQGNFIAFNPI